ncbi:hypothetical protein B0O99DRAFT_663407 [Bisporella sp. PMI_857]|nr:hypothetical protein B0O99DRAFT_663407 [Bisporella sp. PMI_857]
MPLVKKATIIGASPAGLATALLLRQANNIQPVIYEICSEPTTFGGAINIPSNGLRLLQKLGLKTGFGSVRIKRTDLIEVLLKEVQKQEIAISFGEQLTKITEGKNEKVTATFADGSTDMADLLLGCDGIHYVVWKLHINPQMQPEYSGISNMFEHAHAHGGCITNPPPRQLLSSALHVTSTGKGLFAVIPCTTTSDHLYWLYSREVPIPDNHDARDGWEVFGKKEAGGFKTDLREMLLQGGRWLKGRCLLLVEATYTMQPHTGQGGLMPLEDAFMLTRVLGYPRQPLGEAFAKRVS